MNPGRDMILRFRSDYRTDQGWAPAIIHPFGRLRTVQAPFA